MCGGGKKCRHLLQAYHWFLASLLRNFHSQGLRTPVVLVIVGDSLFAVQGTKDRRRYNELLVVAKASKSCGHTAEITPESHSQLTAAKLVYPCC